MQPLAGYTGKPDNVFMVHPVVLSVQIVYRDYILSECAGCWYQVCGDSTGNSKGLHLSGCNHTYVHDVTIYHAGSFAIFQEGGSNNTFE